MTTNWKDYGEEYGEFFKFTEDDNILIGEWRGTVPNKGKFGGLNGKVKTVDGEVIKFNLSSALECLEDLDIGTKVKIRFLEKIELDGGQTFKDFKIQIEDKDDDVDADDDIEVEEEEEEEEE